jgi:hypothetical protein
MKSEKLEVVKGSGNVFRDVGHKVRRVERIASVPASRA